MGRRARAVALAAGLLAAAAAGWRYGPAATLTLALAVPAVEPLLAPFSDAPSPEEVGVPDGDRRVPADLYRPAAPRGALLLVHGLSRDGRRHPELVRVARLLAARRQLVLVPDLPGLRAFRLEGREVRTIRAALAYVAQRHPRVGVAGFSFGAGPALLAAADVPDVRVVGSFGGYAHLAHVVRFVTTGIHEHHGRRLATRQEEYNRWKLLALLVPFVGDPADGRRLGEIAARRLADPGDDTAVPEAALGAEGQRVLALVANRDDEAVPGLLAALPPVARAALTALSPLAVADRLRGRLVLAHGAGDDSIPYSESLRLAEAAAPARVAILSTFHHTGPAGLLRSAAGRAADGWRLFRVVDALLE